jgi:SAM-dependent methyltransferase
VGSLAALPYAAGAFDGVWCANVLQYLTDAGMLAAVRELRRVVRPGGVLAVKDTDMQLMRIHPADPHLVTRLSLATIAHPSTSQQALGSLVGRRLRRLLEAAGLEEVTQRTWLIERWAPLTAVERSFYREWFVYLRELAEELDLPAADQEAWRRLAAGELLDDPAFYVSEGQVVAAGRVPLPVRR